MRNKYSIILDQYRYDLIILSLIEMKNYLTREGRYTDAVDEVLIKVIHAKKNPI